jgi:hypothetical protein
MHSTSVLPSQVEASQEGSAHAFSHAACPLFSEQTSPAFESQATSVYTKHPAASGAHVRRVLAFAQVAASGIAHRFGNASQATMPVPAASLPQAATRTTNAETTKTDTPRNFMPAPEARNGPLRAFCNARKNVGLDGATCERMDPLTEVSRPHVRLALFRTCR